MLIDHTYFVSGSRAIQNATIGHSVSQSAMVVHDVIRGHIRHNQAMYLGQILGPALGMKIDSYLSALDCGESNNIPLFDAICSRLRESFADYVFYQILRSGNSLATVTGLVRLKNANEYTAPINRQVIVWNTMVERHRLFYAWCSTEAALASIPQSEELTTRINSLNI